MISKAWDIANILKHLGEENKKSSIISEDFTAEISYQTDFDSSSSEIFPIEEKFEGFKSTDSLLDEPELKTRNTRINQKIFKIVFVKIKAKTI